MINSKEINLELTIKTVFLVVLPFLLSSKRFKLIELNAMFKPGVRHLECFEWDKKKDIRDKKRYQGDMSFLCRPVINLIKVQVLYA